MIMVSTGNSSTSAGISPKVTLAWILVLSATALVFWSGSFGSIIDVNGNGRDEVGTNLLRRQLATSLTNFNDPKSVMEQRKGDGNGWDNRIEQVQIESSQQADADIADGKVAFRVIFPQISDGTPILFVPQEILVEVHNPKQVDYSVTVVSPNKYTGTATLLNSNQKPLVFSWKPMFPGTYDVLVHEIDREDYWSKTPLVQPPFPFIVNEGEPGLGVAQLEERIMNSPPCQTVNQVDLYSHWDGDWLGPELHLTERLRTGWTFVPSKDSMGCKLEAFDTNLIQSVPEKKSIVILGRSVERGIFLSLIDMMLDYEEKKMLVDSAIAKCWGRASFTKGNLEVTYQDFRVNMFETPDTPQMIECHNEKLVKDGSSFFGNATRVWEELFQQGEENWPSVIFMVTGLGSNSAYRLDPHTKSFVDTLPPSWPGTLFLGDFHLSGRDAGMVGIDTYQNYVQEIKQSVLSLNDPRVRWFDGHGISKEMRMYSQDGEERIAKSQHFHHIITARKLEWSLGHKEYPEAIVTRSNITEMMGQLLLGHALGPKQDLIEQLNKENASPNSNMRWCHACPKCMLPFHIKPYPQMECIDGPVTQQEMDYPCSGRESVLNNVESVCPESCLQTTSTYSFDTESDTVLVRLCPVETAVSA